MNANTGYKAALGDLAPGDLRVADRLHSQRLTAHASPRCAVDANKNSPATTVATTTRCGRRGDLLRARDNLTDAAWERPNTAFRANRWDELECAWASRYRAAPT